MSFALCMPATGLLPMMLPKRMCHTVDFSPSTLQWFIMVLLLQGCSMKRQAALTLAVDLIIVLRSRKQH